MPKALISIVVPVFNEELNLRGFHDEVTEVMKDLVDYDWEFVFVDDGSRDGSFRLLEELSARDPVVRALRFPRNFGSHVAIAAGIDHCHGDSAIIMAADLQDPPSLIPEFIAKARQGFDVVWGARTGRDDGKVRAW